MAAARSRYRVSLRPGSNGYFPGTVRVDAGSGAGPHPSTSAWRGYHLRPCRGLAARGAGGGARGEDPASAGIPPARRAPRLRPARHADGRKDHRSRSPVGSRSGGERGARAAQGQAMGPPCIASRESSPDHGPLLPGARSPPLARRAPRAASATPADLALARRTGPGPRRLGILATQGLGIPHPLAISIALGSFPWRLEPSCGGRPHDSGTGPQP